MMNKRDSLANIMTPEQKEEIKGLEEALSHFGLGNDDKAYEKVLFSFFMAAKEAKEAFCPVGSFNFDRKGFIPGKIKTTAGEMYVLCTSPDEAALCPEETIVLIGIDHIVSTAFGDDDSNGICLNPYGKHPCFIPRNYIQRILGNGSAM